MPHAQRYEIEAWLGDDHGLDDAQIDELVSIADGLAEQHPDGDDSWEQALVAAYRLMVEPADDVVSDLAERRATAHAAELDALAGLQQAAVILINRGDATEAGFARQAGVDRMTVRKWMGK
ncbi:hypothetical protein AB0467_34340 [Streptomyces sp. NPDC052095]|uniref:hypothetical protein n=1 Tax=unclassified Streptomyces TaxID=2593676 RepID=UPI00344DAB5C